MQAIRVFFNNSHLLIANAAPKGADQLYSTLIEGDNAVFGFRMLPQVLFEKEEGNILVVTPHVEQTLESIFEYADGIVAAGGLVSNEKDELLVIFRRGFWDLPKGKVDKGERILHAALREVEEETGVKAFNTDENAIITYHTYVLKGKNCIKEAHWYRMRSAVSTTQLTPQTEEDIMAVIWASRQKLEELRSGFYPLIQELLITAGWLK
ncbi:MAG: NUDIX domain-containing protein [Chitinophagales bacterium]